MTEQGLSTPYPRQVPPTLVIEGDLAQARLAPGAPGLIASVRRMLVVGGRGFLRGAGASGTVDVFGTDGQVVCAIGLDPLIARRIYTSGATLTEEEIRTGLEQLRESDEDVEQRMREEMVRAYIDGGKYAVEQMGNAIRDGDERALHRSWEMARKVIGLRRRLSAEGAAPASVATGAAPAGTAPEKDDDSGGQPRQTLPTEGTTGR